MGRPGRRPGPTTTPELIRESARELFAERGFRGTTVRAVAEHAGVNAALVHHYYGSKNELFAAALRLPINPVEVLDDLLADGPTPQEFARRLVTFFVRAWREPATGPSLRAVLRGAAGTAEGAESVRVLAEQVVIARISTALDVPPLRVAVAMSHVIGLMLGATIIEVAPLARATDDDLVALVAPAIAAYLTPAPLG